MMLSALNGYNSLVPPMRDQVTEYFRQLQETIVEALEKLDPQASPFNWDSWDRAEGGGGRSATFAVKDTTIYETVLEKSGVNISMIHGALSAPSIKQMRTEHAKLPYDPDSGGKLPFFAAGISLVIHPRSPLIPAVHANYRYFEVTEVLDSEVRPSFSENNTEAPLNPKVLAWWFGGITDLTPMYLNELEAAHFHSTLKAACDKYSPAFSPAFKKNCDDYLFNAHRNEHRGIGGIRFDDLCDEPHRLFAKDGIEEIERPHSIDVLFDFTRHCGNSFLPSYLPIINQDFHHPNTRLEIGTSQLTRQRRWQLLRRGRYIEYNLVYERGTKFGLVTPGVRAENVLMGMPPEARWEYQSEMGIDKEGEPDNSEEGLMLAVLRKPRDWA